MRAMHKRLLSKVICGMLMNYPDLMLQVRFYHCHVIISSFRFLKTDNCVILIYDKILSLTVSRLKNRCIPCIFWVTAIFTVVAKYSNLFFPFAFFLNGSHIAFGYELIIRSETTDFMEIIRDKLPSV